MKDLDWVKATLRERDKRYEQRWRAQEKNIATALTATDKRLDILNELRGDVATNTELSALEKRIGALEEGKKAFSNLGAIVVGAFGVLSVIITVVILLTR